MKKLLSLMFASMVVFSLAMPVFANDSTTAPAATKTAKTTKAKTTKSHKSHKATTPASAPAKTN